MDFVLEDQLALEDELRVGLGLKRTESLALGESLSFSTLWPGRSAQESLNLSDLAILNASFKVALSDALALLDSVNIKKPEALTDSVSLSDSVTIAVESALLSVGVSLEEYFSLGDSLSFSGPSRAAIGDSITLTDAVHVNLKPTDLSYLRNYLNDI